LSQSAGFYAHHRVLDLLLVQCFHNLCVVVKDGLDELSFFLFVNGLLTVINHEGFESKSHSFLILFATLRGGHQRLTRQDIHISLPFFLLPYRAQHVFRRPSWQQSQEEHQIKCLLFSRCVQELNNGTATQSQRGHVLFGDALLPQ